MDNSILIKLAISPQLDKIQFIDQLTNPNPWSITSLQASLNNKQIQVVLLQHAVIGFMISANNLAFSELLLIAIHPDFQNQGYASLLINQLVKTNQLKQIPKILLEVRKSNSKALQFYKNHQFLAISSRKDYYSNPTEDAIILEKQC